MGEVGICNLPVETNAAKNDGGEMRIIIDVPDDELEEVREHLEQNLLAIELNLDIVRPEQKLAARVLMAAGMLGDVREIRKEQP